MDIAKKIGRKLREARKASGHTQKEVADLLGLSYVAYGVFERGRTLISLEYLLQLPRILGKPVTYFLPDSVVSEAEGQDLTLDPLLQEVMEAWPELDQAGREFVRNAARLMKERMEGVKEERPGLQLVTEEKESGEE